MVIVEPAGKDELAELVLGIVCSAAVFGSSCLTVARASPKPGAADAFRPAIGLPKVVCDVTVVTDESLDMVVPLKMVLLHSDGVLNDGYQV